MRARIIAFVALAVALAAVFVGLGLWQLDRLAERRAANDQTRRVLAMPAVPFSSLQYEAERSNRHAFVEGVPDYEREFVHAGRSRNGSPGVHIFTPVRTGDTTAVLVNRGWVYAADAATVDLSRWREKRRVFLGYVREMPAQDTSAPGKGRAVRTLSHASVQKLFPYPVHRAYLIARDVATDTTPARLPEPDLTNGPHLTYAIQWFCFAAIALAGAAAVVVRSRAQRAGSPSA